MRGNGNATQKSEDVIAVDALHTVYYGPVQRIASCIMWRVLLNNPWGIPGDQDLMLERGARRMAASMALWYEQNNVPQDRRVGSLSLSMFGDRKGHKVRAADDDGHPGCGLKLKAAECGAILPWAASLLRGPVGADVQHKDELLRAANAMLAWLELSREAENVVTAAQAQALVDQAQRTLLYMDAAKMHFVPKFHFFAHLSVNARRMGGPKLYSCFRDESLNQILRDIAEGCHRARQEERIFTHFQLLGDLAWSDYLWGEPQ